MDRWLSTDCKLKISLFILTCYLSYLLSISFTVEERLRAVEATNVEIKEVLIAKNDRLAAVEIENENLKSIVIAINNKQNVAKKDNRMAIGESKQTGQNATFRTCLEAHLAVPSLTSGLHWIDPDGQGVGDEPIQVYCDMTTGTTSILHDSESPTNVGHCVNPGCYSKSIKYFTTKRQLIALIELSSECHQSIRYDCNYAPFKINGVLYSWWNDRNGEPQYFWAGSNSNVSSCQCGIDRNCFELIMSCNCDSNLPLPKYDEGVITNKHILPVTQLNFGRTFLEISSGVHTLGKFECSGQLVKGIPTSCSDLWRMGHILNGLYSVMRTKMVENVYCDFTKLPSEKGFENRLGYVDVKSLPVYFYVQKDNPFKKTDIPIVFELERVNIGGAMDLKSGIFTAPRTGVYFFTFSGVARFTPSSSVGDEILGIGLHLNGPSIGITPSIKTERSEDDYYMLSLQSTLNLKAGDKVWLQIHWAETACLHDSKNHLTHFTGQLLHEDISQPSSLN